jgi:hypothetical protein
MNNESYIRIALSNLAALLARVNLLAATKQDRYRFLRVATFSLRYDKNGDLTTGYDYSYRLGYYSMTQEVTQSTLEHPVAFWM